MGADDNRGMNTSLSIGGAVELSHWGVIRARGAEAPKFLHSQLTNDLLSLSPSRAQLAGFCSAKGRLQASFVAWKSNAGDVLLACSASVLPATLKRLSMFVLRAQCRLSDATPELRLWGLAGAAARQYVEGLAVWGQQERQGATIIRLPDAAGLLRCVSVGPAPDHSPSSAPPVLSLAQWRWLEVQSGVPLVELATVEQFVPQMLNFELIGGVDFQKGCYPGQEVVARSQYRGTLKRRMFLFDIDGAAAAGQEVFHDADLAQPAGMVVNAAPHPSQGGSSALVEIKLAALANGALHLGSGDGPRLRLVDLPYAVPLPAVPTV